jgi:YD repeat-containing protein
MAWSQSVTPEDEYRKLIKVSEDIQPLGENPFGESIGLYDGSLSFEVTDVSLRGTGPTLQLGRTLSTQDALPFALNAQRPFGDWNLDIPRIETATANQKNVTGWQTSNNAATGRCSYFGKPPVVSAMLASAHPWEPKDWWDGYHLIVPGAGSQELMPRSLENTHSPQMSGMSFSIVTTHDWMISCGVAADDGNEGFLAIAPDGTRYTFSHLVYRPMAPLDTSADGMPLKRRRAFMYVTKIQDRFGNTLSYNYDTTSGNLVSIVASDGRQLTVQYASGGILISSVMLKASDGSVRTWSYQYINYTGNSELPTLQKVILPDGSAWMYDIGAFQDATVTTEGGSCGGNTVAMLVPNSTSGTITSPSGLTGTFTLKAMMHGRSYVPRLCYSIGTVPPGGPPYSELPQVYYQLSITGKTVSGAGVPTQTWTYNYSPANQSWSDDACASNSSCPASVYTDVIDPAGRNVRYTFSNRFDASEGQLLRTDYYTGDANSAVLRSETNVYAEPSSGPWPSSMVIDLQDRDNQARTTKLSPLKQRTITQEGDTYTWQALAFDSYARATDVKRFSSIAGQSAIEETTAYRDDPAHWVLGLPQAVTNVASGEIELSNAYNADDTLASRARFGQILMRYTYDSQGQLASFTDGNNHTTSLSKYKRGIPQSISYPDGTSQSLGVDDFGQVTAITDQAGHTTSYSYDPVGRIKQINYPAGDSVAWYAKQFAYDYVTSAERGLGAGHWRRTTTIGNAQTITYFDAELRPVLSDVSNGNSHVTSANAYDWKGQTTFASYSVNGSPNLGSVTSGTHHSYDALGRLTQTQADSELGALTTSTAYLAGAGERSTDPKTNVTTTFYQVFDEPAYKDPIRVEAPAGIVQTISRDLYGNPLAITQSGPYGSEIDSVTKTLVYDAYHRLCRTTEPESGSTVMAYDAANNLAWSAQGQSISGSGCGQEQVAAAAQTARSYDGMNRVLTIVPPGGTQSTSYTYDALGNIKTSVSGVATQTFTYNTRNLPTSQTLSIAGTNYSWGIGYNYDSYGHLNAVGYPASNGLSEGVAYNPDPLGRATQVGTYVSGITYFPNGQVAGFNFANGTSYLAQQNGRQLLSNFTYGVGSSLNLSEDLSYDANGNVTHVNDLVNGQRTKTFGYDALNRLTSASANNLYGRESYTYDALNNLRSRLTSGNTLTFNYDAANHLTGVMQAGSTVTTYGYDAQGNRNRLSSGGNTTQYNFDAANQLLQIPGLESYAYDATGRRIAKTAADGNVTYYFYDQAGQLMFQYQPSTYLATNYIYLGRQLVAKNVTDVTVLTAAQVNATVALVGAPSLSADGQQISATIDISNHGTATLTSSGPHPVHLGTHLVDGSGNVLVNDLTRANIPDIAPGAHAAVTITVPANQVIGTGKSIQYLPVQEGVAWFNTWGTQPVTLGPFTTCSAGNATGLCNTGSAFTAGQVNVMLSLVNGPTLSADGQTVTATVDINNQGTVTLSSSGKYPVNLGDHFVDASGKILVNDITRASIPDIAPGTHAAVAISVPANGLLGTGRLLQFIPVQEGIAWFDRYGTKPVTVGPYVTPISPFNSFTGSYAVSWSAIDGAVSYTLQQQIDGGNWTSIQTGSATSWTANGEGNGTYAYRVQACGTSSCGPWSNTASTGVLLPPPVPASISTPVSSFNGSFSVSWSGVTIPAAVQYVLQEQIDNGGWNTVQTSSATNWSISGKGNGTYHYRVQACDAAGCSGWSGTASIGVLLPPADAPNLSGPTSSFNGSYSVSWTGVSAATNYVLQEQINGGSWTTVQNSNANSWSTSGRGNATYRYQVQACNAAGCGPWSNVVTVGVLLPPATPTGLSVSASGPSYKPTVTVKWNAASTATTYNVEESDNTDGVTTFYSGANTTASSVMFVEGTAQFRVNACNAAGCSPWSGYVSIILHSGG